MISENKKPDTERRLADPASFAIEKQLEEFVPWSVSVDYLSQVNVINCWTVSLCWRKVFVTSRHFYEMDCKNFTSQRAFFSI